MTPTNSLHLLLDELEQSLRQFEVNYADRPSDYLRAPLLRRRRAVSRLRNQIGAGVRPTSTIQPVPGGLPRLIAGEQRLVEAYARTLEDSIASEPLRRLLREQKSESEQALLAFIFHQRRG